MHIMRSQVSSTPESWNAENVQRHTIIWNFLSLWKMPFMTCRKLAACVDCKRYLCNAWKISENAICRYLWNIWRISDLSATSCLCSLLKIFAFYLSLCALRLRCLASKLVSYSLQFFRGKLKQVGIKIFPIFKRKTQASWYHILSYFSEENSSNLVSYSFPFLGE